MVTGKMAKKGHTEEEILGVLREAASDTTVAQLAASAASASMPGRGSQSGSAISRRRLSQEEFLEETA